MTWKLSHQDPALCISDHHMILNGEYLDKVLQAILNDVNSSYWEIPTDSIVLLHESNYGPVGSINPHYACYGPLPYNMTRRFSRLPCDGKELLSLVCESKPVGIEE